jgi:DNA-directed RNA polymerase beta' subunit
MLSASKCKMISAQSSKPNVCIVQDSLLGAYRMTLGLVPVTKKDFYNISLKIDVGLEKIKRKMQQIRRVYKDKGKKVQCFHGKGLISLVLPEDLIYERKNNTDPNEPVVKIYKGVLYEGALDKSTLGAVSNSLIHVIYKEYGADVASEFIDGIQFVTNNWLLVSGFSVGLGDCMVRKDKEQEINDVIEKCYIEAEGIKTTTSNPNIREIRILGTLSKAKDIGLKIAKDALEPTNNFISTVVSGSKGDFFNIAQITGLLGQQNVLGQRVKPTLNNGKRTLPHYPFDKLDLKDEYESRGFIDSSFIKGLNPKQFYMHSMSGREGCSDTAMSTSTSGYIQRRIIKLTEDIKIQYDGTVRDAIGSIYQLSYGEDYLDPKCLIKVGKNNEICNITSIVNKLNMKHEDQKKK